MAAGGPDPGGPDPGGGAHGGSHGGYPPLQYSDYPRQSSLKHDNSDDYQKSLDAHRFAGGTRNHGGKSRTSSGAYASYAAPQRYSYFSENTRASKPTATRSDIHRVVSMMAITRPTSFGHRDNQVHAQISSSTVMPSDRFEADFGVSRHITSNLDVFTTFDPSAPPRSVFIGNGLTMLSAGEGSVLLESKIPGATVKLERVLYVPNAKRNLFSVSQAESCGTRIGFEGGRCQIVNNGKIHLEGTS
ncbi:hypothetical protein FOA52_013066 [Chlamydomonas sp. UWO 241]|nr:hypothetical protein FOA52_013066 [Chlamydomonas sp. UWO 241]